MSTDAIAEEPSVTGLDPTTAWWHRPVATDEATMSEAEIEAVWAMVRSAAQVLDTVSDMLERVLERSIADD